MNTLKNHFLFTLLFMAVTSCLHDEVEFINLLPGQIDHDKGLNPRDNGIPAPEVIKEEFPEAIGWRITWDDSNINSENWKKYAGIFSTLDGSLYSIEDLNSDDSQKTVNADIFLPFGNIGAPSRSSSLSNQYVAKNTKFKRSDMSVADLEAITAYNPTLFHLLFDTESYMVDEVQPVYSETGSYYYETDDIFIFETDRDPVRYGAIRIVKKDNPVIIEVVVQKGGIDGIISQ